MHFTVTHTPHTHNFKHSSDDCHTACSPHAYHMTQQLTNSTHNFNHTSAVMQIHITTSSQQSVAEHHNNPFHRNTYIHTHSHTSQLYVRERQTSQQTNITHNNSNKHTTNLKYPIALTQSRTSTNHIITTRRNIAPLQNTSPHSYNHTYHHVT